MRMQLPGAACVAGGPGKEEGTLVRCSLARMGELMSGLSP